MKSVAGNYWATVPEYALCASFSKITHRKAT
jgi:hypothetical protein